MVLRLRQPVRGGLSRAAQQNARASKKRRHKLAPAARHGRWLTMATAQEPVTELNEDDISEMDIQAASSEPAALVKAATRRMQAAQPPAHNPPPRNQSAQRVAPQPAAAQPVVPQQLRATRCPQPFPLSPSRRPGSFGRRAAHKLMWAERHDPVAGSGFRISRETSRRPGGRIDMMWAETLGAHASNLAIAAGSLPQPEKPSPRKPPSITRPTAETRLNRCRPITRGTLRQDRPQRTNPSQRRDPSDLETDATPWRRRTH